MFTAGGRGGGGIGAIQNQGIYQSIVNNRTFISDAFHKTTLGYGTLDCICITFETV